MATWEMLCKFPGRPLIDAREILPWGRALPVSPDIRSNFAKWLGIAGFLGPAGLVALVFLLRAGFFHFRDDFTGMNAVGFFIGWGFILLLSGSACCILSLLLRPRSLVASIGLAANILPLLGGLFLWYV